MFIPKIWWDLNKKDIFQNLNTIKRMILLEDYDVSIFFTTEYSENLLKMK